ncbi:MAG: ATP-binding cassette domain-containing protein [Saprospiraceae bacterium]|nr:ATP-binding cassette domain-containing protein [Saprospiraceae bacterium]
MMSVLVTKGLRKTYGKLVALEGLDLDIKAGNVYGLLGPNGSGKTTTLGIILGILSQDGGTYEWFDGKYGKKARMKIGSILETPNFYPYLNAVENLKIVARIKNVGYDQFDELLELVDLAHRKRSKFKTFSLGMKQRLAIAATLVGHPEVLIFDEPTNGLDPQGIAEVRNILKRIADSGRTVLMASHILDEVEKICSHVAIIKRGKLLATGPVGAILSNDMLLEVGSTDMEALKAFLQSNPMIKTINPLNGFLECIVDESLSVSEINEKAFTSGIVLNHLVSRKRRLEEEFLEITQDA